jgi:hypothetical protein
MLASTALLMLASMFPKGILKDLPAGRESDPIAAKKG